MNESLMSARWLEQRILELGRIGRNAQGGISRLAYSEEWLEAQNLCVEWMQDLGLETRIDSVGNVFGKLRGKSDRVILTGSHLDTVVNGGAYDGAYGIVGALAAVGTIVERGIVPSRSIEVVALCEEEGSRFLMTCIGSRAITGTLTQRDLALTVDRSGNSLGAVLTGAGLDISRYDQCHRTDIDGFLELHIEQGPILEQLGAEIGIVDTISGQERFNVQLIGTAAHAGTTPMKYRRDAVAATAEVVLAIEKMAEGYGEGTVVTVGLVEVPGGMSNVVAGKVVFTIDFRAPTLTIKERLSSQIEETIREVSRKRQLRAKSVRFTNVVPTSMHPEVQTIIQHVATAREKAVHYMPSGAGHDSQIFGQSVPTGMIFIPSHKGISHHPDEYSAPLNLLYGVECLYDALLEMADKPVFRWGDRVFGIVPG